jgi:hypothetical protein
METMPPYTYKFVKNQGSDSENQKKQNKKDKHGYLSKDVKVINDLIDDLSKLKTADNATTAAHAVTAAAAVATNTNTVAAATHATSGEMTNPLEIDNDKESLQSVSSSSSHRSTEPKAKQKEQVRHITFLLYKPLGPWVFINVRYSIVKDSNTDSWKLKFQNPFHNH